jgi:hypothetical protein
MLDSTFFLCLPCPAFGTHGAEFQAMADDLLTLHVPYLVTDPIQQHLLRILDMPTAHAANRVISHKLGSRRVAVDLPQFRRQPLTLGQNPLELLDHPILPYC